jgi:predicted dehydrogenase
VHYELAKRLRMANTCRRSLYGDLRKAEELVELADRKNLRIMVDHISPAGPKIKQLIDEGLGPLYYYDSMRQLGALPA